jgi:Tfp pilus assembly protein, pilus retraction ATPase PilT
MEFVFTDKKCIISQREIGADTVSFVEALRAALAVEPERRAAATDEAMLVEAAGGRVLIHPSPPQNLKVTTPLDLRVAKMLLAERASA